MGTFTADQRPRKKIEAQDGEKIAVVDDKILESFSPHILGLGEITQKSRQFDAMCASLDLAGFTNFCKQVDPHLVLPGYLSAFLQFLFDEIKKETVHKQYEGGCELWHDLPFFVKFCGDGLICLWNT